MTAGAYATNVQPAYLDADTADEEIVAAAKFLYSFSIRETAGSTATVRIRKTDIAGDVLAVISLAANTSHAARIGSDVAGVAVEGQAIFVERVSGTTEVVVHYAS